jgi:two-component sensor histidine kinase
VITELVHNALEHGLSESGTLLELRVEREENSMRVTVIDDGAGVPEGFTLEGNTNLGLQIVNTLTLNELAGSIKFVKPEKGTEVWITFQM